MFHDHDPITKRKSHGCTVKQSVSDTQISRCSLAAAVGDLEALFDFASRIHEAPFVFPFFVLYVKLDFPGFVKGLEPSGLLILKIA
jgi:hypothetical protein